MSPRDMFVRIAVMAVACFILLGIATAAFAQSAFTETRYCGHPAREADGKIQRSAAVIAAFKEQHPCPANGRTSGACPGWAIDHVIPLAVCGCDSVSNMQWLKNEIKSCSGAACKDRWERKVYACPPEAAK